MIHVEQITKAHECDIRIPNDPFPINGRYKVTFDGEKWSGAVSYDNTDAQMTFPDEKYDFDEMSKDSYFFGAYNDGKCIGLLVLQKHYLKYMHVYDLKVSQKYRRMGVGRMLIDAAAAFAKDNGYRGLFLEAQDNNPTACEFYINSGFRIGGFDTEVYKGSNQEGKSDIKFYLDV